MNLAPAFSLAAASALLSCALHSQTHNLRNDPIIPSSAKPTCVVPAKDFAAWFVDGKVVLDGGVNPADSVQFDDSTTCNFHRWSWQMFLWLTSPMGEPGKYVFNSSPFFNVQTGGKLVEETSVSVRGEKVIDPEQAGGDAGALLSRSGELVMYSVHINDVMAYFQSGEKGGAIDADQFPTSKAELDKVAAYASQKFGATIQDGKSLAMEFKTSWIRLPADQASRFITITADVPKYVKNADNTVWAWDGKALEKGVTLGLVGFHVVGSAKGHPEMIWATFEHTDNAPNQDFHYITRDGKSTLAQSFHKDGTPKNSNWTFFGPNGSRLDANQELAHKRSDGGGKSSVVGKSGPIRPSDTYRIHAWGNAATDVKNNTEILSINNSVMGQLADGDLRSRYALIGAVWSNGIVPPLAGNELEGSQRLANATMETYFQEQDCFYCHNARGDGNKPKLNQLSHIYSGLGEIPPR